jgi:hypothetical protein
MNTRRTILLGLATALTSLAVTLRRDAAAAEPAARTLLLEEEPAARAIGYLGNAAKVDTIANPAYRRGQSCTTCAFADLGTGRRRGCSVVPGRLILATGWCKLWKLRGSA